MKKFFKIIGIFILVIIVLLGLLIASPFIFKDKFIELAKEELNKNVNAAIDFGEFDLTVFENFPNLSFSLEDVTAIGIDDFAGDTLLAFNRFSAEIDIMSVFSDQIAVKAIVLDHPVIRGKVLKGGQANWDIAPPSDTTTVVEEDTTTSEPMNYKLNLKKFQIIDGDIIYDDEDMELYAEMKHFNFDLSGDMSLDFTTLNTSLEIGAITLVSEGVKYLNKTNIEIKADLDADLENSKYTLKENLIRLNSLELAFIGWVEMIGDDINMDMSFNASKTGFKSILSLIPAIYMKDFESVQTDGKLALNGMAKGTYNEESLPGFNLDLLIENAMFKYPDLPGSAKDININLNISNPDGIDDHTVIDMKKFHVDFAGTPIDASLLVKTPVSDAQLDANVKGTIDLDNMKNIVPLDDMTLNGIIYANITMKGRLSTLEKEDYENFDARGDLDISNFNFKNEDLPQGVLISHANMTIAPMSFELNAFDAVIGKSDFHLKGQMQDFLAYVFRDETIKGIFDFNSTYINVNEFMGEEEAETTTESTESSDMSLVEVPKNIDFVLNANLVKVIYDNMDIDNIVGNITVKNGKLGMNNLNMKLLEGSMLMNGSYSTENIQDPNFAFKLQIVDFDIPRTYETFNTVKKMAPIAESCKGKFSITIDLDSKLQQNMEPDLATTNGSGSLSTENITITNSKSLSKLADELKFSKFKNVAFNNIFLTFKIENGEITVDPFTTTFGQSEAVIGGTQGIDQSLDYTIKLNIPKSELGGEANQVMDGAMSEASKYGVNVQTSSTIKVNVLVGGTVTDPTIKLDFSDQAKSMVEDVKEQVKEKVKEEFDKARQDAIKKAKEQAANLMAEADKQSAVLMKEAEKQATNVRSAGKTSADKVRSEAENSAKQVENAANGKPKMLKDAAKKSADKLRYEGEQKAKQLENEANSKANGLVSTAKSKSDQLKTKAKSEGDELIRKAENR